MSAATLFAAVYGDRAVSGDRQGSVVGDDISVSCGCFHIAVDVVAVQIDRERFPGRNL